MSRDQKRIQKRKTRRLSIEERGRRLRELRRTSEKIDSQDRKAAKAINRIVRERVAMENWAIQAEGKIDEKVRLQILHNIEILKAMEEDYKNESQDRIDLQDKLKESGAESLSDMMNALQEKAKSEAVAREIEMSMKSDEYLPFSVIRGIECSSEEIDEIPSSD